MVADAGPGLSGTEKQTYVWTLCVQSPQDFSPTKAFWPHTSNCGRQSGPSLGGVCSAVTALVTGRAESGGKKGLGELKAVGWALAEMRPKRARVGRFRRVGQGEVGVVIVEHGKREWTCAFARGNSGRRRRSGQLYRSRGQASQARTDVIRGEADSYWQRVACNASKG